MALPRPLGSLRTIQRTTARHPCLEVAPLGVPAGVDAYPLLDTHTRERAGRSDFATHFTGLDYLGLWTTRGRHTFGLPGKLGCTACRFLGGG
jgi:hypothetical protein